MLVFSRRGSFYGETSIFEACCDKTCLRDYWAVQSQKMARGLKFLIKKEERMYFQCSENNQLISCTVIMQLFCTFVFTYCKVRFSHDVAQ